MTCSPKNIIQSSDMLDILNFRSGDTQDIVTTIFRMDKEADKYINIEAAQCLRGDNDYQTLKNVWRFVRRNVRYQPDSPGKEIVKSPAALFKLGFGDCKSFSISEAALLRALGFKGIRYRFVSYGKSNTVTHVYIVCKINGEDVILDAVHTAFDDEVPYSFKKDIPALKSSSITGIQGINRSISFSKTIGFGLIALALFRL